jgi:hypothetical protein
VHVSEHPRASQRHRGTLAVHCPHPVHRLHRGRREHSVFNGDQLLLRGAEPSALVDEHRSHGLRPWELERSVETRLGSAQHATTSSDSIAVGRNPQRAPQGSSGLTGELQPRAPMRADVGTGHRAQLLDALTPFDSEQREHFAPPAMHSPTLVLEHPFVVGARVNQPADGSRRFHDGGPKHRACRGAPSRVKSRGSLSHARSAALQSHAVTRPSSASRGGAR